LVAVAAWIQIAAAVTLGVVRFVNTNPVIHGAEWWIADLALVALLAAPAIAVLRARSRYTLLAAGLVTLVVSLPLLISLAGFPLVLLAVTYLVAAVKADRDAPRLGRLAVTVLMLGVPPILLWMILATSTVCWSKTDYRDGRTVYERDRSAEAASSDGTFSSSSGPPKVDEVSQESGCDTGAIPPVRSGIAIAFVTVGTVLIGRDRTS
jgi:hypothetical protein